MQQIVSVFTALNLSPANSKLINESNIGVNATAISIVDILASVMSLEDVLGYRLTVDCTHAVADSDSFKWLFRGGEPNTISMITLN